MSKFAESLSTVQDYREAEVKRLEGKIITPLMNYGLLCKQTKNDIKSSFAAIDLEISQKKKLDMTRSKHPSDRQKISQLENSLQKASLEATRSSKNLEQQIELIFCSFKFRMNYIRIKKKYLTQASGVSIYKPIQGWRHERKRQWIFVENRPWTDAAKEANKPGKRLTELIESIPKSEWKIFLGDRVQILKGIDEDKQGLVCSISEKGIGAMWKG
ncbi:CBY1-interacting BAR domain-containing protein 2-like [Physella acuta]|uniref:CBY1-interacting BAR domain-containing protein 2-like n=1 Tax=Physella acuta TaxID=109671 RepID=UPI0027DCC469|nr:CBY1-interacting BAR domain-containing protein 2-like [Physella acuta]